MNTVKWWHRIRLSPEVKTPGISDHDSDDLNLIEKRFGLTKELVENKTILDIGAYDGLFSFEAEKRGAKSVLATDIYQNALNPEDPNKPFRIAKEALNSKVEFEFKDVYNLDAAQKFDVVLFYGVLYHLVNPLEALQKIANVTNEVAVIETTASSVKNPPMFEIRPNHDGDNTNMFYPNYTGLEKALLWAGFKRVEKIHDSGSRITVKVYK